MADTHERRGSGSIRRLPSGNFQASYVLPKRLRGDGPPKRYTRTFAPALAGLKLKTDVKTAERAAEIRAEKWLEAEKAAIEDGSWTPPDRRRAEAEATRPQTFGEYAATWIEEREHPKTKRPLAELTKDSYRAALKNYLAPEFGDLSLDAITPEHVDRWFKGLLRDSPTRRAQVYSFARTLMNSATGVTGPVAGAGNPFYERGAGNAEVQSRDEHIYTDEELVALLGRMREDRQAMILLARYCGLRYGEIVALTGKDVDLKKGVVRVRNSVAFPAGREPVLKEPKSQAGRRDVRIPPTLVPELERLIGDKTGLLFPSASGGYLRKTAFYGKPPVFKDGKWKPIGNGWHAALAAAGRWDADKNLRPTFHDLRATGATEVAGYTRNLAEVQKWLGDSSAQAAIRYVRAADEAMDTIADAMGARATGVLGALAREK